MLHYAVMKLKKYLMFLSCTTSCLFSQIDSVSFDLSAFYQKAGTNASYRIVDYNYRAAFCIVKAQDSSEYILKPNSAHGPFKHVAKDFHNSTLFEVESLNGVSSTYSTRFKYTYDSYSWLDLYSEEWTKSIVMYTYKPGFESYVLQQDGRKYGPYDNKPDLVWSNDTSTIYQVLKKDNQHFELFRDHKSLGHYKLYKCRYCGGKTDDDIVYSDMFKNRFGKHFLVQSDSLFGPLKTLKMSGISYVNHSNYFITHLIQNPHEDFCRLFRNKKDFGFQLTADAAGRYDMFPDSSLLFKAGYLKRYEFLEHEDEVYFYHSKFGLIDPPPVAKSKLTHKGLGVQILSNTNFYLEGLYGEYLTERFLYKKNKFIDAISNGFVVIDNNYLYEKDRQYYMNGKKLDLPKNEAFCVYHSDTFYVIKTGAKTWELYKNRVKQNTQNIDVNDNIKRFHFNYYPLQQQLVLSMVTGYPGKISHEKECPRGCYYYDYDIYRNKVVTDVDYTNSEDMVSLYGERKQITFQNKNSFVYDHRLYHFNLSRSDDYQDETGWHNQMLYLKKDKARLTIYLLR